MGNLSFHTQHQNGDYTDHAGVSVSADSHSDVTIHHNTRSFVAGSTYSEDGLSQHGMDAVIYKVTEAGVPVSVFGVDAVPADGITAPTKQTGERRGARTATWPTLHAVAERQLASVGALLAHMQRIMRSAEPLRNRSDSATFKHELWRQLRVES